MVKTCFLNTPIGNLGITCNDSAITKIFFHTTLCEASGTDTPLLRQAVDELTAYFAGKRAEFTFPISPVGTPFQQQVWEALRSIPYGQTRTYGQIAAQIGHPTAYRAVGMANNRNPIAIAIPCHRVIGSNGKLVGYAGGVDIKEFLLNMEKDK